MSTPHPTKLAAALIKARAFLGEIPTPEKTYPQAQVTREVIQALEEVIHIYLLEFTAADLETQLTEWKKKYG